jgi:hypothetical protein
VILTASAGASLIVTDALIERFGTLTIIVLGEILTSVVAGLASQPLGGLTRSAASLHDQVMAGRVSAGARQSVAKDHGSNCVWTETWRDRLGSASMMGRY